MSHFGNVKKGVVCKRTLMAAIVQVCKEGRGLFFFCFFLLSFQCTNENVSKPNVPVFSSRLLRADSHMKRRSDLQRRIKLINQKTCAKSQTIYECVHLALVFSFFFFSFPPQCVLFTFRVFIVHLDVNNIL